MTQEQAMQLYNKEQQKYYEYCGYIQSYNNKVAEYQIERHNKLVSADAKQTEIKKNQDLFDSIGSTLSSRDGLFSHLTKINSKVEEAAGNFSTMVSSNTINAFNLMDTFGEEATGANSNLTEVFNLIDSGKAAISGFIEELNQEYQSIQFRIQELDSNINKAQCMISQYESDKQRCLINMAYYKKIMTTVSN